MKSNNTGFIIFIVITLIIILVPSSAKTETANIDSLLKELKNSKNEERYEILHDLGWAYQNISYEKANSYEQQAVYLARVLHDSIKVARSLYHLARIHSTENYGTAVEFAERSIDMILENEDFTNAAKYYKNLGLIHEKNYEYEVALKAYSNAYEYAKRYSEDEEIANIQYDLGQAHIEVGKHNEALVFFNLALSFYNSNPILYEFEISSTVNYIGIVYWYFGKYSMASENFFKALSFFNKNESNIQRAYLEMNIGICYKSVGNIVFGLKYLYSARNYLLEINAIKELPSIYSKIGHAYFEISYYNYSLKYHFKGLKLCKSNNDILEFARTLNNIALVFNDLGNYNIAIKLLHKAYKINTKHNQIYSLSVNLINLGKVYYNSSKYENSIKLYNQALTQKSQIGDALGYADVNKNIAELYIKTNQIDKSLPYLTEALTISNEIGAKDIIKDTYNSFSKYYEAQQFYEEAIEYLQLHEQMKDSITSNEKLAGIAQMEIEFTALEKQKELNLLESENKIISSEMEKEELIHIKIIMVTIALIILVLALILYYLSIKRTNKRMSREIELRIASESELLKLKKGLEQRVQERISELKDVNLNLKTTITEKQNSEKDLIEAERMAGIGEMAAGLAHEIRNPIAIIKSTAQYLSVNYSETIPFVKQLIESSDAINRIITRLMDFARLKPLVLEKVELPELIKNCLIKFGETIKLKQIHFKEEFAGKTYSVKIDPVLFEELFSNIIQNALDALSEHGSIEIRMKREIPNIIIEFSDSGSGIKNVNEVLKPFFTDKKHHTGLGLNFVQHIIGLHKGKLEINSIYKEGTTVSLFLPVN